MTWADAKRTLELDWRKEWADIVAWTWDTTFLAETLELDCLFKKGNRIEFLAAKKRLLNLCFPGLAVNLTATPERSTAPSTSQGSLIFSAASEADASPSKSSEPVAQPRRSKRPNSESGVGRARKR